MENIEHEYTHEIVCPHCGYEFMDSWEFESEDIGELDCDECDESFVAHRNISVSYSTKKSLTPKEVRSDNR